MLHKSTETPDEQKETDSAEIINLVTAICHYQQLLELLNLELIRKEEELERVQADRERYKHLLIDASGMPTLFNPANRHFETGTRLIDKQPSSRKRSNSF